MVGSFQRRGLRKAAEILGGEVHLRAFLRVSSVDLFNWLSGGAAVPEDIVRRVVGFLADHEGAAQQPERQGLNPPAASIR